MAFQVVAAALRNDIEITASDGIFSSCVQRRSAATDAFTAPQHQPCNISLYPYPHPITSITTSSGSTAAGGASAAAAAACTVHHGMRRP